MSATTKKTGRQHRRGAGRPKGSRTVLVKPRLHPVANLGLAMYGDLLGSFGAICGVLLWGTTNPAIEIEALKKFGRENGLPERSPEEWAAHAKKWAQDMAARIAAILLDRREAGDAQFFRDLDEMIERINSGRFPDDGYRTALLAFVDKRNSFSSAPVAPLAVAELCDYLNGHVSKSARAIRRDLHLLGIPFSAKRGRPLGSTDLFQDHAGVRDRAPSAIPVEVRAMARKYKKSTVHPWRKRRRSPRKTRSGISRN